MRNRKLTSFQIRIYIRLRKFSGYKDKSKSILSTEQNTPSAYSYLVEIRFYARYNNNINILTNI